MREMKDHVGRQINCPDNPHRIISICPAITETLFALDIGQNVIGRTKYCIFPEDKVEQVPIVGGTKEVNVDLIKQLAPDLIIAEKEENTAAIVEQLEKIAPVFVAEVQSIEDSYRLIETLGMLTNKEELSEIIVHQAREEFSQLANIANGHIAYAIWRKPYMVVGKTTYINSVLTHIGFNNPFTRKDGRYPAVSVEALQEVALDYLLLASEPFPYSEKHIAEFQAFLPETNIILVDGEMFWYGAKMLDAARYLAELVKSKM